MHAGSGLSVPPPKFTSRVHRPLPQVTGCRDRSGNGGGATGLALSLGSETEGAAHLKVALN